jgi:hypothetical protein
MKIYIKKKGTKKPHKWGELFKRFDQLRNKAATPIIIITKRIEIHIGEKTHHQDHAMTPTSLRTKKIRNNAPHPNPPPVV